MGQKVNPLGLRLGTNKTWNSFWYTDKKSIAKNIKEDYVIRNYIKNTKIVPLQMLQLNAPKAQLQ